MSLADQLRVLSEEAESQRRNREQINLEQAFAALANKLTDAAKAGRRHFVVSVHKKHNAALTAWMERNKLGYFHSAESEVEHQNTIFWGDVSEVVHRMSLPSMVIRADGTFEFRTP